jgi:hypothetical protein
VVRGRCAPPPRAQPLTLLALRAANLYLRGVETLLATCHAYVRGSRGASVQRSAGVAAAVFPNQPEGGVYNNAVLERELAAARANAI